MMMTSFSLKIWETGRRKLNASRCNPKLHGESSCLVEVQLEMPLILPVAQYSCIGIPLQYVGYLACSPELGMDRVGIKAQSRPRPDRLDGQTRSKNERSASKDVVDGWP